MTVQTDSIQRVLRDVGDIRRAIARAEGVRQTGDLGYVPGVMHLRLHVLLLVLALGLVLYEVFAHPTVTDLLYYSHWLQRLRFVGVGLLALILAAFTASLYLVLWQAARRNGEELSDYLARNFLYLRSLSFSSDLFVKFFAVAVAILSSRADWVAPLLFVFIGDYLLQGRLFILPYRLSIILGSVCFGLGGVQLLFIEGNLLYPLGVFIAVCALSLGNIVRERRAAARLEE